MKIEFPFRGESQLLNGKTREKVSGEFILQGNGNLENAMVSDIYDPRYIREFIEQYCPLMQYKGFKRALLSTLRAGVLDNGLPVHEKVGEPDELVRLIWGEQDAPVPIKHSQRLITAVPRAEFHPAPDSGHIPHSEKPQVVNPILIEF